jgi:hypothetical protein
VRLREQAMFGLGVEVVIGDGMEASRRFLPKLPFSQNLKPLGMHGGVRSRSLGVLGTSSPLEKQIN